MVVANVLYEKSVFCSTVELSHDSTSGVRRKSVAAGELTSQSNYNKSVPKMAF